MKGILLKVGLEMGKYRKRPVIVEAYMTDLAMDIDTLEGVMHANAGDYIITGVNGEMYPCKPDIFSKTYELIREDETEKVKNKTFGKQLRNIRKERGIKVKELSEKVGISENVIYDYERGDVEPTISRLGWIADFFGVSTDELLGRDKTVKG